MNEANLRPTLMNVASFRNCGVIRGYSRYALLTSPVTMRIRPRCRLAGLFVLCLCLILSGSVINKDLPLSARMNSFSQNRRNPSPPNKHVGLTRNPSHLSPSLVFHNIDTGSFILLNESLPYSEWYSDVDSVDNVVYANKGHAIRSCLDLLQSQDNGPEFHPDSFNLPVKEIKSIGELSRQAQGLFSFVALRVSRTDPDFNVSYTNPRLWGMNLCHHLDSNKYHDWNPSYLRFCTSTITGSKNQVEDFAPRRIPLLICSRNTFLTSDGFLRRHDLRVWPIPGCHTWSKPNEIHDRYDMTRDVVFAIAQYWAEAVYHQLIECLSRLAVHYDELMHMKNIKIQIGDSQVARNFMMFLGFQEQRLVSGYVVAETVLAPEASGCGRARVYALRKLRELLTRKLLETYSGETLQRDKHILIIRRSSGPRVVTNIDKIIARLEKEFPNEKIKVFRDDPVPPVPKLLRAFYEAKLVIGPHGAGLSNTVVCKPQTPVLEFMIDAEDVNVCFVWQSQAMGLRHYGFAPKGSSTMGSFHVDEDMVASYVHHILENPKELHEMNRSTDFGSF